ncbi:MAG: EamA family transporter RarD, partial [Kiloniellales bacterium]
VATLARRWHIVVAALTVRRTLLLLGASTLLMFVNWGAFIYAVEVERITEISLGYYVNPLVNILLGVLVLGERLGPRRWLAIALAAVGVLAFAWEVSGLPWISLTLAFAFGFYGLIRKLTPLDSVDGLLVETALLLPLALGYLVYLEAAGGGTSLLAGDLGQVVLLLLAGPVSAIPLIWFASGARRLNYSTVGFFQYIAPTLQLLLAVFAYGEPFTRAHGVTFACIWGALLLYTWASLRPGHGPKPATPPV